MIPHSLVLLLQIFHMMKDKRHFEQQHGSPADSAGSRDASDADPAGKQEGADGAQGDLNECAENGNRNLSHPSAVSLETVGKTGKCVKLPHPIAEQYGWGFCVPGPLSLPGHPECIWMIHTHSAFAAQADTHMSSIRLTGILVFRNSLSS